MPNECSDVIFSKYDVLQFVGGPTHGENIKPGTIGIVEAVTDDKVLVRIPTEYHGTKLFWFDYSQWVSFG